MLDSDQELAARIAQGDDEAFTHFIEDHYDGIYRYVCCHIWDSSECNDCVQDILIAVLESAHRFEGRSRLKTWVFGIAKFKILKRIKQKARAQDLFVPLADLGQHAGWGDHQIEANYDLKRVFAAMEQLPSAAAEIITLRDIEGLTTQETVEVLGIGQSAVKSRLHRARLQLMALLRQEPSP